MDATKLKVKVAQCVNLASDQKLAQTKFEGVAVNYAIAKAIAAATEVLETYQKKRRELLYEYGIIDEVTGNLKTNPDESLVFKEPRKRRELEEKTQVMLDETVEIIVPQIKLSQLVTATPSPDIFRSLLPFIAED